MIWLTFYSFEHCYLDPKIKNTKAKIGRLKHRLDRLQQKKEKLQKHVPSAVFGTKKLFRSQFTKEEFEPIMKDGKLFSLPPETNR
ncbi:hypothetical protein V7024_08275 [Bacillus sp. JJ864]|uniref:hypothetical protein n=1 Tax=Bacillus sp. JJ864 TaxID=3122975 RepID=UPI002FFF8556